jgi:hypothetical protein
MVAARFAETMENLQHSTRRTSERLNKSLRSSWEKHKDYNLAHFQSQPNLQKRISIKLLYLGTHFAFNEFVTDIDEKILHILCKVFVTLIIPAIFFKFRTALRTSYKHSNPIFSTDRSRNGRNHLLHTTVILVPRSFPSCLHGYQRATISCHLYLILKFSVNSLASVAWSVIYSPLIYTDFIVSLGQDRMKRSYSDIQ